MFLVLKDDHIFKPFPSCYFRLKTEVQKLREDFLTGFIGALTWEQLSHWEALPTFSRTSALSLATSSLLCVSASLSWSSSAARPSSSLNLPMAVPSPTCSRSCCIRAVPKNESENTVLMGECVILITGCFTGTWQPPEIECWLVPILCLLCVGLGEHWTKVSVSLGSPRSRVCQCCLHPKDDHSLTPEFVLLISNLLIAFLSLLLR